MRKNRINVHCHICNKELFRCPSVINPRNFCGRDCYNKSLGESFKGKKNPRWSGGLKNFKCYQCSKIFQGRSHGIIKNSTSKFCSDKCYRTYKGNLQKGEGHWNWKGGEGRTTKPIRSLKAYRDWRQNIKERDSHRCVDCKSNENKLHVHHLVNLAKIVTDIILKNGKLIYTDKRLFDLNNGITLCKSCHKVRHKKMGRIAGTPTAKAGTISSRALRKFKEGSETRDTTVSPQPPTRKG